MVLSVTWDYVRDVVSLLRWMHVFGAIIWIGLTAFFWFMESRLRPPTPGGSEPTEGVAGETYYLHGGMFYFRRYRPEGPIELPKTVVWHPQWYAYGTWVTGFALLVVIYYWKADAYLIDPSVADLSSTSAVAISVALLAIGWFVYDRLARWLLEREWLLTAILFALVITTAYMLSHVYSSRGVVIEMGAILGTWMAGNVLFVWEPYHRALYRAHAEKSSKLDSRLPALSWQRAKHNAYLAPPVLFAMLATHFSFVEASPHAWIALIGFMTVGGLLRHFYIWRNRGRAVWAVPAAAMVLFIFLILWLNPTATSDALTQTKTSSVELASGKTIFVSAGCSGCHTLAAAGASGTAGPNLDQVKPSRALVATTVTEGRGAMPPFNGRLSRAQIEDVAAYVSTIAGK